MPGQPWSIVRRYVLLEGRRGQVGIGPPYVGPSYLAIKTLDLRMVLDRADLSVVWQGRIVDVLPRGWCGSDLLLVYDLNTGEDLVLKATEGRELWRAPSEGGADVWGDTAVCPAKENEIQIRRGVDGSVLARAPMPQRTDGVTVVGETALTTAGDLIVAVRLRDAEVAWQLSVGEDLGPGKGAADIRPHPSGRLAAVRRGAQLGLLDVETGHFVWKRPDPLGGSGGVLMSHGRLGFYFARELRLLDEATGETMVEARLAPTIWESAPVVHDDWMVVVDEEGHIITVSLPDGKAVGVQREKGASFNGCASVDGRLLVAGKDGALWIYEPAGASVLGSPKDATSAPRSRGTNRTGSGKSTKSPAKNKAP